MSNEVKGNKSKGFQFFDECFYSFEQAKCWGVKLSECFIILPLDCRVALYELISLSISQYNNKGQTTTPRTSCPTLYDKRVGSFTSPAENPARPRPGEKTVKCTFEWL